MNRDYAANDVQPGTRWYIWGQHQEIIERTMIASNETGAPPMIPVVRLCPLDADGNRITNGRKKRLPVHAWRIAYYGEPSRAFAADART